MDDLGYVLAGYLATGATLAMYRLSLARRTRRARHLLSALSGRQPTVRRAGR